MGKVIKVPYSEKLLLAFFLFIYDKNITTFASYQQQRFSAAVLMKTILNFLQFEKRA